MRNWATKALGYDPYILARSREFLGQNFRDRLDSANAGIKQIRGEKNLQEGARSWLGIIAPDGSQHLFSFREFFFRRRINPGFSRKDDCFEPMPQK